MKGGIIVPTGSATITTTAFGQQQLAVGCGISGPESPGTRKGFFILCTVTHRLFGTGATVTPGPQADLTGPFRTKSAAGSIPQKNCIDDVETVQATRNVWSPTVKWGTSNVE